MTIPRCPICRIMILPKCSTCDGIFTHDCKSEILFTNQCLECLKKKGMG